MHCMLGVHVALMVWEIYDPGGVSKSHRSLSDHLSFAFPLEGHSVKVCMNKTVILTGELYFMVTLKPNIYQRSFKVCTVRRSFCSCNLVFLCARPFCVSVTASSSHRSEVSVKTQRRATAGEVWSERNRNFRVISELLWLQTLLWFLWRSKNWTEKCDWSTEVGWMTTTEFAHASLIPRNKSTFKSNTIATLLLLLTWATHSWLSGSNPNTNPSSDVNADTYSH